MKTYLKIVFICGAISMLSCNQDKVKETNTISDFELVNAETSGFKFSNDLIDSPQNNIVEYLYYYNGGGVAIGDINNDGLEDVYFCANQKPDKLYLNKGNLVFEDISEKAGISMDVSWSTGVTMDDVNGDGFLDIYVCKVSKYSTKGINHNVLYVNQGDGTFIEMSKAYGLDFSGYSTQSTFLDYDHDGDLDMYLLNHAVHSVRSYGKADKRNEKDSLSGDLFYENKLNESGRFVDVTKEVGIYNSPLGYGLAIACADVNNDGWTDIYVGNDFHENDYLYINDGKKHFIESSSKYFTHTSQFSMGVDIVDMNGDGWVDIFTTDMMPFDMEVALVSGGEDSDQIKKIKADLGFEVQNARNHFQINQQDGQFSDIAYYTNMYATDWSWSVLMQDFDNDSNNDIFISNGIVKRPNNLDYINFLNEYDSTNPENNAERYLKLIEKMPSQPIHNLLFKNKGMLNFTPLHESFIGTPSFSTGAAYGDLDNDGDVDLITNNINQEAFLYENKNTLKGNFIALKFKTNHDGISTKGVKAIIFAAEKKYTKELYTTKGFMSSSSPIMHFGLGDFLKVDSIKIVWPDQTMQILTDVKVNQVNVVDIKQEGKTYLAVNPPLNKECLVIPFKHEESNYFDENAEKLIPERLSHDGPALISEDLNGDGILDFYIGGSHNQAAKLFIGNSNGSYQELNVPDFQQDAKYEDVDAATIDFDGDGDRDIYVVSGGNDNLELNKLLEDRLYLNNGHGVFKRIPLSLPHTNGSCVAVGDFDKDGFEDLFIGARSIPGSYGLSPYSFVLKNMNGQAVEIAYKERYGMVTDGVWSDLENDGDLDLIMCGDWMPITVYINDGTGQLKEETVSLGLDQATGFWNTITCTDLDHDGHKDILAGNTGLNSKWQASIETPIKLYVGDFDANGATDPLIFSWYFGTYMPIASRDKLASQMPIIKKTFPSYDSFKKVKDISDMFPNYSKNVLESRTVSELRSMVFTYKSGKYIGTPLSTEDQMAEINDFQLADNGDIYYVGNNHNYVSDMGMSSSNAGRLLRGFNIANNQFANSESFGLSNKVDAKKIQKAVKGKMLIATNNGYLYITQ